MNTIIFDMGMVLVDFRWKALLEKDLGYSPQEADEISHSVFLHPLWQEFDRGIMGDENVLAQMKEESPQHREAIERIWTHFKDVCHPYDYSETLVKILHDKGYKIYILSNYGDTLLRLDRDDFKFLKHVDGELISAHVKQMKPDDEIFENLIRTFELNPEDCVFFDDNQKNCEASEKNGIQSVKVDSLESIMEGLKVWFDEDVTELMIPFKENRRQRRDNKSQVVIARIEDQSYEAIKKSVYDVIDHLGGLQDIIHAGDKVLIKPNLVAVPEERLSGAVTRWEVVLAIAERVREEGAHPYIAESASCGADTEDVLFVCEYDHIRQKGFNIIDLKHAEEKRIPVSNGRLLSELKSWLPVAEADVIISVPVMKTHDQTEVTLGLKNLKGLITDQQKKEFHRYGVIEGVVDLIQTLKPAMTIVDGTFGQEGIGPVFGDTVEMDLIIGSKDVVACDAVTSAVMGYAPEEAMITVEACERGLGKMDLAEIEVKGLNIDQVKRRFLRANEVQLENVAPYTLLVADATCTGCRNTVRSSMVEFENNQNSDALRGKIIVTGPLMENELPENATKENLIIVGKCARHLRHRGIFMPGCPPLNEDLVEVILKNK